MPDPFGSFSWICSHTVLPQCNLFFSQLYNVNPPFLTALFPQNSTFFDPYSVTGSSASGDTNVLTAMSDAGTGVASNCEIPRVGRLGSVGDIALVVTSALSVIFALGLFWMSGRRRAAVGRTELRIMFLLYALHSAFQIVTMSSLLEQGSVALVALSSIHVATVVAFFWVLLGNALIALQVVEDGTLAALAPLIIITILFFGPTLYISLDTGFAWTSTFRIKAVDVPVLKEITLFVLTLIWPAVAAFLYWVIMLYIVLVVLREKKPAFLYTGAMILFAVAQVIFFLASEPLCEASNRRVNTAFITTLLNSGAMGLIYLAWKSITEDDWGSDPYPTYY